MKWSVIIVFVVLISVTYGTKYCEVTKKENEKCGNNGKCTLQECAPATTTPAPTVAPSAGHSRKRRAADPVVAKCTKCTGGKVCRYQCTGENGSIMHGLSPLVLLVGLLTKLFLIG